MNQMKKNQMQINLKLTNMFDVATIEDVANAILDVYLDKANCLYIYKHYNELMDEYKDQIDVSDSKVAEFMDMYEDIYYDDYDESLNESKKSKKKKKLKEDRDIDFSPPTSIDLLHEKEAMDYQLIEPLINFFDELENNYKCDITWNFGRRLSDDKMTAGVDVYLSGDFDNEDSEDYWLKKDEEILDRIRDNLPEYGFKFDDSLGYDINPWKEHMFGDGYHTQIIEIEDVDECLTEERKPKYWNSMFAQKVIDAYEKGDLTFDNIKEWDKNYNGGIVPNPPFNTGEILKYYLNHSKNLSEDTIKQNGKWVNKGKEGTHGTFKTKKEADAQRKAMFAHNFKG